MVLVPPVQSVADHAESKAHFDARLDKANADAAEMKAAYDKVGAIAGCPGHTLNTLLRYTPYWLWRLQSAVDAAQQQAQLEAQIGKANTDAATMKAAYDKVGAPPVPL
jgi:hypothetical protein